MTTTPPAPGERGEPVHEPGRVDPQRAKLAALWTLVLDRFHDYLHWATVVADDPRPHRGGPHDPDA